MPRIFTLKTPTIIQWSQQSNPSSGVTTQHPTGPLTFTALVDGLYRFTGLSSHNHSNQYTDLRTQWVIGGTATRADTILAALSSGGVINSEDDQRTSFAIFNALAGQTITVVPSYLVVYSLTSHVFNFTHFFELISDQ